MDGVRGWDVGCVVAGSTKGSTWGGHLGERWQYCDVSYPLLPDLQERSPP